MNSLNYVNYVNTEIKFLMADIGRIKSNFEKIIGDKDIDLHARWETFRRAPDCLKEHSTYVPQFIDMDDLCDRWARHETVDTRVFINYLYEMFEDADRNIPEPVVKLINELKCQIMSNNIGSFSYDW